MRYTALIIVLLLTLSCRPQSADVSPIKLSVAPGVDREDAVNKRIITVLQAFLESKNQSATSNKYWLTSDFKKFVYPYTLMPRHC